MSHVVSIGNAFDGLCLVGPFNDNEDAQEYGDTLRNVEWAVIELDCPPWTPRDETPQEDPACTCANPNCSTSQFVDSVLRSSYCSS